MGRLLGPRGMQSEQSLGRQERDREEASGVHRHGTITRRAAACQKP